MSNLRPRAKRATGIKFAQPGLVVCPICSQKAVEDNNALPKFLRKREVGPRAVQRKYVVAHMRSVHGMQVVAPEAMPVELPALSRPSIFKRAIKAITGR